MGVLLYAVFIGSVNLKCLFLKHADLLNLIAYADGTNDLIAISDRIGVPIQTLSQMVEKLVAAGLFHVVKEGEGNC